MEINSALSVTDDETEQELTERVSCERLATEPLNFEPYGCYEALLQALNPLLTKILPVIQRDNRLRWLDKVAFEKSQGRPEAVISQLTNGVMLTWITCLFYLFSANRRCQIYAVVVSYYSFFLIIKCCLLTLHRFTTIYA